MADSDNTMTLPSVTYRLRRKRSPVDKRQAGASDRNERSAADPVVALLHEWREAHHAALLLCRLQQRCETRLLKANADPTQNRIGYSTARSLEIDAVDAEQRLLDAVATTPAHSLTGVMAKLEIISGGGGGENSEVPDAFPWPQLRSALADLRDIAAREGDHSASEKKNK
ncbi:hypothetical protein ABFT80_14175 [Mesorhizobium sp. SB112]|uniref:hypothetical protein n=1 Tax=Mesorhizobium sp. SB112 TaxID=3151853 RepID=UPI003265ECD7